MKTQKQTNLNFAYLWFKKYDIKTTLSKDKLFISSHNIEVSAEDIKTRAKLYLKEEMQKINLINN